MTTFKKIRANQKGFTLVELIVVVAILGILAAVAVPNYMNYLYSSRVNTDIDTARAIINTARTYSMTHPDIALDDIDIGDIADEADLTDKKMASCDTDIQSLTLETYTGNNDSVYFQINFEAADDKAGKYAGSYWVSESGDLPTPTKGGDESKKDGGSSSTGGNGNG